MRFLKADQIFPVSTAPIQNGTVVIKDDGTIIETLIGNSPDVPADQTETFNGIICPGFVNAHCHLELSYLKGVIAEGNGLDVFIKDIENVRRKFDAADIEKAIEKAEDEMLKNGIVAVADICNDVFTISQKTGNRIRYYNLIELYAFDAGKAGKAFEKWSGVKKEFQARLDEIHTSALTPHATYSVSPGLMKLIAEDGYESGAVLSIHNQECMDENYFFISGKGKIAERLQSFGIDLSGWKPSGFNSLRSTIVNMPECNELLFVHNTYSNEEDISFAKNYTTRAWWCLCPNANLYIENRLPDLKLFSGMKERVVLGTDSLASNHSLSILEEMKTISRNEKSVSLETLIQWATLNGAKLFGFEQELGSIEKGKKPGLNLISGINKGKLTENSSVKRII